MYDSRATLGPYTQPIKTDGSSKPISKLTHIHNTHNKLRLWWSPFEIKILFVEIMVSLFSPSVMQEEKDRKKDEPLVDLAAMSDGIQGDVSISAVLPLVLNTSRTEKFCGTISYFNRSQSKYMLGQLFSRHQNVALP